MKKAFYLAALLLLLLTSLQFLFPTHPGQASKSAITLPWQIEKLADGNTRIFGLVPEISTLAQARELLGSDLSIAVIAAPNETGTLEAFHDSLAAGFVTGKLILTMDATPETVSAMKQRAQKSDYMESSTRKYTLSAADLDSAYRLPIRAIGFIPTVNLDPETVEKRFGRPAERLRSSANSEHFLYPDQGLDIAVNSEGKELLQYVAPSRFEALRDLLVRNIKPQ